MIKRIAKAAGTITLNVLTGAVNNAGLGFGAMAGLGLVYGTYCWGLEVGRKKATEEYAAKVAKEESVGRYPWGQPIGDDFTTEDTNHE